MNLLRSLVMSASESAGSDSAGFQPGLAHPPAVSARNQESAVARASQAQYAEASVVPDTNPFHTGEQQVHARLHVPRRVLDFNSKMIRDWMPDQHREFFQKQRIMYVATSDGEGGRARAHLLAGDPGFVSSPDPHTLCINIPMLLEGQSSMAHLVPGQSIGLLGLEFHTRRRNRVNGIVASATDKCVTVHVHQSFGNCPKYIQKRAVLVDAGRQGYHAESSSHVEHQGPLGPEQRLLVQDADTFFIATSTAPGAGQRGASNALGSDLSHRGGPPGFVRLSSDGASLRWADYAGNNMFMTLGNILQNSQVGLLFVDYEGGAALHVDGSARILWEDKSLPGAQRVIEVDVVSWSYRPPGGLPITSSPVYEWSPANPEE